MAGWAIDVGILSAIIGYFRGKGEVKAHELTVDNIKLQHKVEKLEEERTEQPAKSFVIEITTAKDAKEPEQLSR